MVMGFSQLPGAALRNAGAAAAADDDDDDDDDECVSNAHSHLYIGGWNSDGPGSFTTIEL